MTLFGKKYRWLLRLAQTASTAVSLLLVVACYKLFGWSIYIGALGVVTCAISLLVPMVIQSAIGDLNVEENRLRLDITDLADLIRSTIANTSAPTFETQMTQNVLQRLHNTIERSHDSHQKQEVRYAAALGTLTTITQDLLNSDCTLKNQLEICRQNTDSVSSNVSAISSLLRNHEHNSQTLANIAKKIHQCRTEVINFGIVTATTAGDHPEVFNAANKIVGTINNLTSELQKTLGHHSALQQSAGTNLNELIATNAALSNNFESAGRHQIAIEQTIARLALAVKKAMTAAQATENDYDAVRQHLTGLQENLEQIASKNLRNEKTATRAMTIIDLAASRRLSINQLPNRDNRQPPSSTEPLIERDLSPASEKKNQSSNTGNIGQIEIAS